MKISLGFSTCPNDTFIFDAMVHGRIDTEGLEFEVMMADVEELNKGVKEGTFAVSKLSYHAYAHVADRYRLLSAGSALGFGNGPLLISKHKIYPDEVPSACVAIPGENTTANLLFQIFFPEAQNKKVYLFSDIEEAILSGEVDAGVIIHENRFTYHKKGLRKIIDLGQEWERKTESPIPLGGIVVSRTLDEEIQAKVNRVMARSVDYAFENPQASYAFVKQHAQEMEDEVMRKHISLYVNEFTRDLGEVGKKAIWTLYREATNAGIFPSVPEDIFVE